MRFIEQGLANRELPPFFLFITEPFFLRFMLRPFFPNIAVVCDVWGTGVSFFKKEEKMCQNTVVLFFFFNLLL